MKQRILLLRYFFLSAFTVILILSIPGCGSSLDLASSWPAQEIKIDGSIQDWHGALQSFPVQNCSLGFKNDDEFLYLCFTTPDRETIFNAIRTGLNISFNSPSDGSKNYTLKYPIINPAVITKSLSVFNSEAFNKEGISFLYQEVLDLQSDFNLLQKEIINMVPAKNEIGIEMKVGSTNNLIVYEIKVPLSSTQYKFPVGTLPGDKIDVIISTDPTKVALKEGMSGGGPSGPTGAGRGSRRGSSTNLNSNETDRPTFTEKFEMAFSLQLAKKN